MKTLKEFDQKKLEIIAREGNLAKEIESIIADEKNNKILAEKEKINNLLKYVDEIYEKKLNLETDRFYIAITGAMNSGKSTLLNALLFKKDVLSVAPTACTAKIAFIEKSDKKEISIKFYTREEWDKWKSETQKSSSVETEDFNRYVEIGERHKDKLGKTEIVSEENLKDYTAKEGEFMPIVNTITIKDPEVSLVGAQIVDTPGTNDPVAFRSKVAEDYIRKADAIIYVMYISEPLGKTDIDTLKDIIHASGKRAENIILVLNKKDSTAGSYYDNEELYTTYPELEEYLEHELGDFLSKHLKDLGLNKCPHVFVCGTAARIAQEKIAGRELDKDMKEREDILDNFLDKDNSEEILNFSGLNEFQEQVEGYLVKNKDESILGQHSRFTEEQKKRALNVFKQEKERFAKDLEARKDIDKLQEKIDAVKAKTSEFERKMKDILKQNDINRQHNEYVEKLNKLCLDNFYWEISRSLKSFNEANAIRKIEDIQNATLSKIEDLAKTHTGWLVGDAEPFEKEAGEFLNKFQDSVEETVNDLLRDLRKNTDDVVCSNVNKIKNFLGKDFQERLDKWSETVSKLLESIDYSTEYVVFPASKVSPEINKVGSDIKKNIDSKINNQKIVLDSIKKKIRDIREESESAFSWKSQNQGIQEMKESIKQALEKTKKDVVKYLKDFESNMNYDLLRWVENYITGQLAENLWNITKGIFENETKEVTDAAQSRLKETKDDLESVKEEYNLKAEEFNKKKAELNNKIQIVEGYISRLETI